MKVCANIISPLILNAQQNGPFLPDLFEGWGGSSTLRLLSMWGNSRTQGWKTQINNNIEPQKSSLAPSLSLP